MPSWNQLIEEIEREPTDEAKGVWLQTRMTESLAEIARIRGGDKPRHVLLYASGFLQKPTVPGEWLMITHEDINGLMSTLYGMDWDAGLTLVLHTPGGVTNAAEQIVEYLRQKFDDLEVIVPTLAMSAGTMISLASDRIVMGRQSQLGPIDPQMATGTGRTVSARAIVEQFERARDEVTKNKDVAHAWAPALQSLGPALLVEAQNALDYSQTMVATWLERWMFSSASRAKSRAKAVARHFNNASKHKSHGRRIDRDEARAQHLTVEDLEADQSLQEAVLTAYHMMTIMFERGAATKLLWSDQGRTWIKNWGAQ